MAYEKQTWTTGDVITQEKLNHMEDGIAGAGSSGNDFEFPTYPIVAGVGGSPDDLIEKLDFGTLVSPNGQYYYGYFTLPTAIVLKPNDVLIFAEQFSIDAYASDGQQNFRHYKNSVTNSANIMWMQNQLGGKVVGFIFLQRPYEDSRVKAIVTCERSGENAEEAIEIFKDFLRKNSSNQQREYLGLFVYRPIENIPQG